MARIPRPGVTGFGPLERGGIDRSLVIGYKVGKRSTGDPRSQLQRSPAQQLNSSVARLAVFTLAWFKVGQGIYVRRLQGNPSHGMHLSAEKSTPLGQRRATVLAVCGSGGERAAGPRVFLRGRHTGGRGRTWLGGRPDQTGQSPLV